MTDAPRKISELAAITTFDVNADLLPVVDVSEPEPGNRNKKATVKQLLDQATFTQSGTSAVARTLDSKLKDLVSVEDFGAVGDGVTDDTAALVAASAHVRSTKGTLVFSRKGPYLCSQQLYWSRMRVIGCDSEIKFSGLSASTDCLRVGGSWRAEKMHISGIHINANNTGRDGVLCDGGTGDAFGVSSDFMIIDGLTVTNAVRDGFAMEPGQNYAWFEDWEIRNLAVYESGRNGIRLLCPNYSSTFINQGLFQNVEVRQAARLQTGFDVWVENANTFPGGKISELTWICGEFDANYANHGPGSFYFHDSRSPQGPNIGMGGWVFIGCTWESTSAVIPGFPPVMKCSTGTKLDDTIVFGGVVAQYGDVILKADAVGNTKIHTASRKVDYLFDSGYKTWYDSNTNLYAGGNDYLRTDVNFQALIVRGTEFRNREYSGGIFGAGGGTSSVSFYSDVSLTGGGGVFSSYPSVAASTSIASLAHYNANLNSLGAGASIANQYGYVAQNFGQATNNYGFFSGLSAGTGKWNFYASGNANNYFAGALKIGAAGAPTAALHVAGGYVGEPQILVQSTNETTEIRILAYDDPSKYLKLICDNGAGIFDSGAFSWNLAGTKKLEFDSNRNLLLDGMARAASSIGTIHLPNATAPTANPSGGGVLYVEGGALKYRGSSGTVTTIAAA